MTTHHTKLDYNPHMTLRVFFTKQLRKPLACLLVLLALSIPTVSTVSAQSFERMFVFGDSLSDVGNLASVTTGQFPYPYFEKRVSNGPLAVDALAQALNLSLSASLHLPGSGGGSAGTNFAVAGANAGSRDIYDLKFQVDTFAARFGTSNLSSSLAVLIIGGNDVRGARDAPNAIRANDILLAASAEINSALTRLAALGVGAILVVNVPDISRIPETRLRADQLPNSAAFIQSARAYTNQLNALINQHADDLRANSAANVIEFDAYSFINNVLDNPSSFGFSNVVDGCFDISPIRFHPDCRFGLNFDAFAFFDNIHPTGRLHAYLGNAMFIALQQNQTEETPVALTPLLMLLLLD